MLIGIVLCLVASACGSSEPGPAASAEAVRERIEYGAEPDNFGWLQLPAVVAPEAGFPVVVLVHGGFWRQGFDLSLMDDLADDLAARGYASWNIEYRRVDGAGGWPQTGDDVAAAIEYVSTLADDWPLDTSRVVTVGHSAGGHLALWALGQENEIHVQGSIGLGAVVQLDFFRESQGLLGGTIDEVPEVYEDAAPVLDPERVVLVQGGADGIVPIESLELARDAGITIIEVAGENHFALIDPASDSWAATIDRIGTFLGSS